MKRLSHIYQKVLLDLRSDTSHASSFKFNLGVSFLLLALSFQFSCKKFVEIPPPVTQLVTTNVFNNDASATAAQINIYSQMQGSESFAMSVNNGLLADELTNYSTVTGYQEFFSNSMSALDINQNGPWINGYNYIYQANAIINGLQTVSGTSAAVKQQLTGESKMVRAFWLFYLSNCYGDVPLVTSTNYTINATIARSPRQQILQQVITDLADAESALNSNYIDGTDTAVTTEKVRPNKYVAAALLARVYLYYAQYDASAYGKALTEANKVIGNTSLFSLCPNLNNVFLKNSTETVWALQTPQPVNNGATTDGANYIVTSYPNYATISPQLLAAFEPNDQREADWIGSFTPDNVTYYYFPYKYKDYNTNGTVDEYVMVLRLAEQYLIRAEAEANLGQTGPAVTDLNTIRNRAGLPNYAGATDKISLSTAILHERQVELFTEWGHRWFDLNRTGNINTVMGSPGNVTQSKGGTWQSFKALYPIPQPEINVDNKLTQNSGY